MCLLLVHHFFPLRSVPMFAVTVLSRGRPWHGCSLSRHIRYIGGFDYMAAFDALSNAPLTSRTARFCIGLQFANTFICSRISGVDTRWGRSCTWFLEVLPTLLMFHRYEWSFYWEPCAPLFTKHTSKKISRLNTGKTVSQYQ